MRVFVLLISIFLLFSVVVYADTPFTSPAGMAFAGGIDGGDFVLVSADTSIKSIRAANSTGLKAVILSLIGNYDTTVTDYTYQNQQGYTQHSIEIEQDWSWILTCVVFIVVLFCTLKLLGAMICKR